MSLFHYIDYEAFKEGIKTIVNDLFNNIKHGLVYYSF